MKDHAFSHEKFLITQFKENGWFYRPIFAKWLPLKESHNAINMTLSFGKLHCTGSITTVALNASIDKLLAFKPYN